MRDSNDRAGFLAEFFPDAADRTEVEAGAQAFVADFGGERLVIG